jgi:hypothetical protein
MALTDLQKTSIYEAVGLKGMGGLYTVARFDAFSVNDIESTSLQWTYADAKTRVDACIAQAVAVAGGEVRLQSHVATFDKWQPLRSVRLGGEVTFNAETEYQNARGRIIDLVGIEVVPIPLAEAIKRAAVPSGFDGEISR